MLAAVCEHLSNAEIATRLFLSVRTVESHVSALRAKLAAPSRSALIARGAAAAVAWTGQVAFPPALAALADRAGFVGRAAQLDALLGCWERATGGRCEVAVVAGEAGVGKTRLAAELADEVKARGGLVLHGRFDEDLAAPYGALAEALVPYLRAIPPDVLLAQVGALGGELDRLLPWLHTCHPDLPPPVEGDPETRRYRLFEAVRELTAGATALAPVLLVLDDLHWAAPPSLGLLRHVLRLPVAARLLVVATYRDNEPGPYLHDAIVDLRRDVSVRQISVPAFDRDEVAELVALSLGPDPQASGLAGALHTQTEGNAFFAAEMLRHLRETGSTRALPEGVAAVVGRRVSRLSAAAAGALRVAAVLGLDCSLAVLGDVARLDRDALLDVVDEAVTARLLTDTACTGPEERVTFAHALVRYALLDQLSGPRRRDLHARAANAMQARFADDLEAHAAQIAHHLTEAGPIGNRATLLTFLTLAARSALANASFAAAQRLVEHGLTLDDVLIPVQRADLLFLLGMTQRNLGHWDDALATWDRSLEISEQAGDRQTVARICDVATFNLIWSFRFPEGEAMARRGLAALGAERSADRGRLLGVFALAVACLGPYDESAAAAAEALEVATELGDDALLGYALAMQSVQRFCFLEHDAALEIGSRAAEVLRSTGDGYSEAGALGFVQLARVGLGRFGDQRAAGAYLWELAGRVGNYSALMHADRWDSVVAFATSGDLDAFGAFADRDLALCLDTGLQGTSCHSWAWIGLVRFLRGDWVQARSALKTAEALEPRGVANGWARGLLFECLAYSGAREEALALLASPRGELPDPGRPNGGGPWMWACSAAEGLVVLGEIERAGAFYPLILECVERTGTVCPHYVDARLLARCAGIAAAAAGEWDAAEVHFETALRQARELPHRPEEAHTLRFYAWMLNRRGRAGDVARAADLSAQAVAAYTAMGMPRHAALADD